MTHMPVRLSADDPRLRARESLQSRLEAARVESQGQPSDIVLVRLEVPVAMPEAVLQRFPDRERVLWHPPEGPHFAGVGIAHTLTAHGSSRFAQIERGGAELWARIRLPAASRRNWDSPRLFGGFAFSPEGASSEAWSEFGSARFILPRVTYAVQHDQAVLTLAIERSELERASSEAVALFHRVYEAILQNPEPLPSRAVRPLCRQELDAESFERQVDQLLERITLGELRKVVAAREVLLSFAAPLDAVATVIGLREQAPECLRFLFSAKDAAFLGATPERLLRKRARLLQTEALAGSIDAGADSPERNLQASPKELEEHELVVSSITRALAPVCDTPKLPSRPGVRSLKHILHLCTPIEATLHVDTHVLELVELLHPTPAVGGVPTRAALEWIQRTEPFDRGWYAGAVGWFDSLGDGDFNVALRAGLVRAERAWLYAGAGIVRESRAAPEYAETTLKLSAVLTSLRSRA